MGISDLYQVIKERCPEILVTTHLSQLAGMKIAIDISIFLNKDVKSAGSERWIDQFIITLCCIKKHGIKPVNIFDGPNPPIEKKKEQDRRRAEAAKTKEKIAQAKKYLKKLETNYIPDSKAVKGELKDSVEMILKRSAPKTNYNDPYDVVVALKSWIIKKEKQNSPILPIYGQKAREIIEIMGFPHYQADGEAETLCSGLCCTGMVDAVLSEDTDVLAYGTPYLLSKIDLAKETVCIVSHEAILNAINFTPFQFRDLCILLSCDYNSRVKGYVPDGRKRKKPAAIGAKGAFLMMEAYETLEEAEKFIEDADPLNYRRCRVLFTPPTKEQLSHITIPYNKEIDKPALRKFIKENKVRITEEYILESWKPALVEFEGGLDVEEDDLENDLDDLENELDAMDEDPEEEGSGEDLFQLEYADAEGEGEDSA